MGITSSSLLSFTIAKPTKFIFNTLAKLFSRTGTYGISIATAVIITNAGWIFTTVGDLLGKAVYIIVVSKIIYFVFETVKYFRGLSQEEIAQRERANDSTIFGRQINIPWQTVAQRATNAASMAADVTSSLYEKSKGLFSSLSLPQFRSNSLQPANQPINANTQIVNLRQSSINSNQLSSFDHEQLEREIEHFKCPLTNKLMKVPTSLKCGHEFEKKSISEYLKKDKKCPVCSETANIEDLREVKSAKISIDNILKRQAVKIRRVLQRRMKEDFGEEEMRGEAVQFKLIPKEE